MKGELLTPILIYLAIISLVTFFVTLRDKIMAKKGSRRISERALITLALFGGSISEYLTMRLIRHKTLHKKFMLGLPIMIILQLIAAVLFLYILH